MKWEKLRKTSSFLSSGHSKERLVIEKRLVFIMHWKRNYPIFKGLCVDNNKVFLESFIKFQDVYVACLLRKNNDIIVWPLDYF